MPDGWVAAYAVAGFLAGSVPPAVAIGRLWGVNVLRDGTRNPGLSNISDLAGKTAAALTFLLDLSVGVFAALIPQWVGGTMWDAAFACIGVVAGRAWSPWLSFRGGRAQMVLLASSVALVPYAGAVFVGIFAVGTAVGQIALSNLVGLVSLWVWTWLLYGDLWAVVYGVVVGVIGVVRRLMGSPDGGSASLVQRLLYDRERPPISGSAAAR